MFIQYWVYVCMDKYMHKSFRYGKQLCLIGTFGDNYNWSFDYMQLCKFLNDHNFGINKMKSKNKHDKW